MTPLPPVLTPVQEVFDGGWSTNEGPRAVLDAAVPPARTPDPGGISAFCGRRRLLSHLLDVADTSGVRFRVCRPAMYGGLWLRSCVNRGATSLRSRGGGMVTPDRSRDAGRWTASMP